jgi:hypothetical protein
LSKDSGDKENISYENYPERESEERPSKGDNYKLLNESELSSFDRARHALNKAEKSEKNFVEINRLKDDIDEITTNLKAVSFSPNKSFLSKSMLNENDQFLGSVNERKAPSPIKLVENYKANKEEPREFESYEPIPRQRTMDNPTQKPPRTKKDPLKGFSKVPTELDGDTSSDEDELAIA